MQAIKRLNAGVIIGRPLNTSCGRPPSAVCSSFGFSLHGQEGCTYSLQEHFLPVGFVKKNKGNLPTSAESSSNYIWKTVVRETRLHVPNINEIATCVYTLLLNKKGELQFVGGKTVGLLSWNGTNIS